MRDAADDRDGGGETAIVGEGARVVATYAGGATIGDTPAALAAAGGVIKKRRAKRRRGLCSLFPLYANVMSRL